MVYIYCENYMLQDMACMLKIAIYICTNIIPAVIIQCYIYTQYVI